MVSERQRREPSAVVVAHSKVISVSNQLEKMAHQLYRDALRHGNEALVLSSEVLLLTLVPPYMASTLSTTSSNPLDEHIAENQFKFGILLPIIISSIHLFLYGVNASLFRMGLGVLRRRTQATNKGNRLFRFSLLSLFVLSSVGVPVGLVSDILDARQAFSLASGLSISVRVSDTQKALTIARTVIITMMGSILDSVLVFRTFVICRWRRRSYAIALVSTLYVLDTLGAILAIWSRAESPSNDAEQFTFRPISSTPDVKLTVSAVCVILHLAVNLFLTVVIARKVLRTTGEVMPLRVGSSKQLKNMIALMIESCLLYIITWSAMLAWQLCHLPTPLLFGSILTQVAGIAPTLLIVRANTQRANTQTETSGTIHFVDHTRAISGSNVIASVEEEIVLDTVGDHSNNKSKTLSSHKPGADQFCV
ncbi:hypothetical protein PM082_009619 [Marasmius tenuissimus]|nr:hypothetical protein PM082_009619 [Marasmius tenuissimus]